MTPLRSVALATLTGCVLSTAPYERRYGELTADDLPTADTDLPVDTDLPEPDGCHADVDGDGHGAGPSVGQAPCPAGFVPLDDDCDDELADVHPGAPELCDGLDQDCLGGTDAGIVSFGDTAQPGLQAALAAARDAEVDDGALATVRVCGGPGAFGLHEVTGLGELDGVSVQGLAVAGERPVIRSLGGRLYEGAGHTALGQLVLDGGNALQEGPAGCVLLEDGADVSLSSVTLRNCRTDGAGGAVRVRAGARLSVSGGSFEDNEALSGGAISAALGAEISVSGTTFERNQAEIGGAIHTLAPLSASGVTMEQNTASLEGGAIWAGAGGSIDGTFLENDAPDGAAVRLSGTQGFGLDGDFQRNGSTPSAAAIHLVEEAYVYTYQLELDEHAIGVLLDDQASWSMFYGYFVVTDCAVGLHQASVDAVVQVYENYGTFADNGIDVLDANGVVHTAPSEPYWDMECLSTGCVIY